MDFLPLSVLGVLRLPRPFVDKYIRPDFPSDLNYLELAHTVRVASLQNAVGTKDAFTNLLTLPQKCIFLSLAFYNAQGPPNGGVSNGGVSRSGLVLPFLSFFVLLGTFPIFPGFSRSARGWSGDFPDASLFSFSDY